VLHYANHGRDNYIYQLKDGVSTLLLEQETKFIQIWKDNLYFLGYNMFDGLHTNLYKYNLESKKLETLFEADITWMFVNENGIYLNLENQGNYEFCRLSFDGQIIEQAQWEFFLLYKDYYLVLEKDYDRFIKIKFIHNSSGECILEIPDVYKGGITTSSLELL